MVDEAGRTRSARARAVAVLLLVLAYALPLLAPPGPAALVLPPPDASLTERLFPGVPSWWVVLRLSSVLVAGILAATLTHGFVVGASNSGAENRGERVSNRFAFGALLVAAVHAGAAHWVARFSRPLQYAYIAAFAVPVLLLAAGDRRHRVRPAGGWEWRSAGPIAGVLAVWLGLRLPMTWRSLRGVDFIDVRQSFDALAQTTSGAFNLVAGTTNYGLSPLYLLFQGGGIAGPSIVLDWQWLRLISMFWILVSAVGLAYVAARWIGGHAAPVVIAAFLFSPFVLSFPLSVVPLFLGPLVTVALLALVVLVERDRRSWAIAALGVAGGLAATRPPTAPAAVLAGAWATWTLCKPPRGQGIAAAIALLSFSAMVLPNLPDLATLQGLGHSFSSARVLWTGMEAGLFGQLSPAYARSVMFMSHPGRFDIVIGALLAPFAIPRTAVRLWGDALCEPCAAGLAACGLAACVVRARRDPDARKLLLLLGVALAPACVSTYDRPSLIRMVIAPVAVALLTGVGFEVVRRGIGTRLPELAVVAIASSAIAISGVVLFDVVNPGILAHAAIGITLSALRGDPVSHPVLLTPTTWDPQDSILFAQHAADNPLAVSPYAGAATLQTLANEATPELLFWNPGLEEQDDVARAICARWPRAALYTLWDAAHLSRAFAARPEGPGWQPQLPAGQWSVGGCDRPLETEGSRATSALRAARQLFDQGRTAEGLQVLRAAARQALVQYQLFETLAAALLANSGKDLDEAAYWASRACEVQGERCLQHDARSAAGAGVRGAPGYENAASDDAARVARLVKDIARARKDAALTAVRRAAGEE